MLSNSEKNEKQPVKPAAKTQLRGGMTLNTTRLKRMIKKLMDNLEKEEATSKASFGELLKLLQVYKDLTAEQVREVEVRWVDRLRTDEEQGT